jgi:hypothetical protein
MSDIKKALTSIIDRREVYVKAEAYYEGDQSEVFPSIRWNRLLKSQGSDFRFNFARTVVDSVLNRLEIANIMSPEERANKLINSIWEQNDLEVDADEIHRKALVYGDCYAIVWPDDSGEITINYNSPLTTVMIYDEENPRVKSYAAKMWETTLDDKKIIRLNLYYPDRIEKYQTFSTIETIVPGTNFTLLEIIDNPWGEIPVFHFRTEKQYGRPEHQDAFGPQDAINKLIVTHMYTIDYQGAPQRYALAAGGNEAEFQDFDDDAVERDNLGSLRNGPGELWYLKGISEVGQFAPANHRTFTEPVKDFVRAMASLTNTPLHYFEKTGNVPSGEALRTAEAPLLKKVEDRKISFGSAWRDMFRFMLRMDGVNTDVQIKWEASESLDSLSAWEVAVKKSVVGVSLEQILIEMGYDLELAQKIAREREMMAGISQGMNTNNVLLQQGAMSDTDRYNQLRRQTEQAGMTVTEENGNIVVSGRSNRN